MKNLIQKIKVKKEYHVDSTGFNKDEWAIRIVHDDGFHIRFDFKNVFEKKKFVTDVIVRIYVRFKAIFTVSRPIDRMIKLVYTSIRFVKSIFVLYSVKR